MPAINSQADIAQDWTGLLDATDKDPELRQAVQAEYQTLKQWLTDLQTLKARQVDLRAQRQEVTQKLGEAIDEGRDMAMRIRAIAKAKLGPRNERLVHFNVAPLRRNSKKLQSTMAEGVTPGTDPASPTRPVV